MSKMSSLLSVVVLCFTLFFNIVNGSQDKKVLNLAVLPTAGSSSLDIAWKPVAKYLEKELDIKVNLKFVNDYAALVSGMQYKHIDIVYFGPESYVQAAQRANAIALVKELNESGIAGYHSIIITKKSSNITSIEQLRGKTWAFTDPNSTSGTLVPSIYLKKIGINPQQYFSKVIYSGSHEASILSVKAGRLDGASTNDLDFKRGIGKGWKEEDFNIIWTSDLIVGAPIAARKDLPQDLLISLQKAFINLKDENILKNLKNKGFIEAKDSDYDPIRELIKNKGK